MRAVLRVSALACVTGLLAGCASVQPPPGGEDDDRPPQIISVTPEPLAPITDLSTPVVFRFDERISERGIGEQSVLVSPRIGRIEVEKERSALRIEPARGWAPETVFRVVLLPGIQDLFGNAREEGAELVFSTGPPIPNTAIAGVIADRITGRALASAFVEALRLPDSLAYVAVADTGGFFAMRHLPPGPYVIRAFRDANRNRRFDEFEDRATTAVTLGVSDTAVVAMGVLAPDSTAARLAQAVPIDSLAIRLLFDDHLDRERPLEGVTAALFRLPDTAAVADSAADPPRALVRDTAAVPVDTLLFPSAHRLLVAARDSARAEAEAAAADSLPPDTVAVSPLDTVEAGIKPDPAAGPQPGRGPRARADTASLPTRELILVPERPLVPEGRYLVRVEGLTNITGLPGGGGQAEFTAPTPPAPDTAAADTAAADTAAVPADTSAAPPDTAPPPDTVAPPDTVPPDTVPPDTGRAQAASSTPDGLPTGGRGAGPVRSGAGERRTQPPEPARPGAFSEPRDGRRRRRPRGR